MRDEIDAQVYQLMNESLKKVDEKIEKEYYDIWLKWPEREEERLELKGKDVENYTILTKVFHAACWPIHDLVKYEIETIKGYSPYRFDDLKKAVAELREKINGENFTKEEGATIQKIMLKTFKQETMVTIAKNSSKELAKVLEYEMGLIHEHSVFSKLYWALREITEEKPE